MRIIDWSSAVCSSDLTAFLSLLVFADAEPDDRRVDRLDGRAVRDRRRRAIDGRSFTDRRAVAGATGIDSDARGAVPRDAPQRPTRQARDAARGRAGARSEEHTSEPQSLMRTTYAAF